MRILLIGNYAPDRQESMLRFAALLERELVACGHIVRLMQPPCVLARSGPAGFGKWLGYIDKFILFPFTLKRALRQFDVVHLCDHSNSIYVRSLLRKPHVVTCHDVLAITSALGEVPENAVSATGRNLQQLILNGLKRAQYVVCVSTLSQTEMLRVTGRPAGSSSVVYNALSYPYSPLPEAEAMARLSALGFDARPPFFLHVGSETWYKNRIGVVKIFEQLQRLPAPPASRLLFVGGPFEQEVSDYVRGTDLGSRITRLSGLSNEDLRAVYSLALALIFPSLTEGFGWPVIEAQACGCPVFSSNRQPLIEVGGEGAVYIDPTDPVAAAAIIARALPERDGICRRGLQNVQRFTVGKMMEGYVRSYQYVMASSKYN
jgi:glycosyltransferase involved in cell wall biosynthesis